MKKFAPWLPYAGIVLLWIVYIILQFTAPRPPSTNPSFQISDTQRIILQLSISIPYLFVWLAAVHGAISFHSYTEAIKDSKEFGAMSRVKSGLYWLLVGILATSFLGQLRSRFLPGHPSHATVTIIVNYGYIVLPLIAFFHLRAGARALLRVKNEPVPVGPRVALALLMVAIGGVMAWFIFNNPTRQVAAGPDMAASYYLSDALIILTIVLPAVLSWILGVLAAYDFRLYVKHATAVIYEKTLPLLSLGIVSIVASSIILQMLLSVGSQALIGLGLLVLLLIIYVFLIFQGLGYLFLAQAANRLAKLEVILKKY